MSRCFVYLILLAYTASAGKWSSTKCSGINTRDANECGHGTCEVYDTFNETAQLMCHCDDAYMDKNGVCNYRQKSMASAFLYSFFLGGFGGDYFYLARGDSSYIALGTFKALTLGGLAFWQVVDFIRLLAGNLKDGNGEDLFDDF